MGSSVYIHFQHLPMLTHIYESYFIRKSVHCYIFYPKIKKNKFNFLWIQKLFQERYLSRSRSNGFLLVSLIKSVVLSNSFRASVSASKKYTPFHSLILAFTVKLGSLGRRKGARLVRRRERLRDRFLRTTFSRTLFRQIDQTINKIFLFLCIQNTVKA